MQVHRYIKLKYICVKCLSYSIDSNLNFSLEWSFILAVGDVKYITYSSFPSFFF